MKSAVEKQEKELSVDEMKAQLEATKLRMKEYLQVNGQKLTLKDLSVDEANKMYKITYVVAVGDKNYDIPSYFKIVNTLNNSYIKFQVPPGQSTPSADATLNDKVYDVNVIREKAKNVDIRIQLNEQKTLAKILEKINTFDLKKDFEIKKDEGLQNTQITGLNNVKL